MIIEGSTLKVEGWESVYSIGILALTVKGDSKSRNAEWQLRLLRLGEQVSKCTMAPFGVSIMIFSYALRFAQNKVRHTNNDNE